MGDLERDLDLDFDFKGLRFLLSRSAILENVTNLVTRLHSCISNVSLKLSGRAGYSACVAAMVTD